MVIMLWGYVPVSLGWPSATHEAQLCALRQPLDRGSAEGCIATAALHDIVTVGCVVFASRKDLYTVCGTGQTFETQHFLHCFVLQYHELAATAVVGQPRCTSALLLVFEHHSCSVQFATTPEQYVQGPALYQALCVPTFGIWDIAGAVGNLISCHRPCGTVNSRRAPMWDRQFPPRAHTRIRLSHRLPCDHSSLHLYHLPRFARFPAV
jgi:hypothetical protein